MSAESDLDPGIEHLTELVGELTRVTLGVADNVRSVGAEVTKINDALEANKKAEDGRLDQIESDLRDARERITKLEQAATQGGRE